MIPKIIHFCWLSDDPFPANIQRCIDSWNKHMPDYEIKRWSTKNFDIHSVPLVEQAYNARKYAFAADYIRCYALYTEGGIYLDSDVLVHKDMTELLEGHRYVTGMEYHPSGSRSYNNQVDRDGHRSANVKEVYGIGAQAAIMASEPKHPLMKKCLDSYTQYSLDYILKNHLLAPVIQCQAMEEYGFLYRNCVQNLDEGITVYPIEVLGQGKNEIDGRYATHMSAASWVVKSKRQKLIEWANNYGIYKNYMWLKDKLGLLK